MLSRQVYDRVAITLNLQEKYKKVYCPECGTDCTGFASCPECDNDLYDY